MRLIIILLFPIMLLQCKPSDKKEGTQSLPADFETFFHKFHSDSLFQISHITFPLEGIQKVNEGPGNILVPIYWNKEDWILHRPFNDHNGSFKRSYHNTGPIIIEFINDNNQFFSMERRFAKVNGEWHLIFYGLKN